ncbi:MAG: hypothetical protein ACI8UO_000707 [Verrucomicrobiales bacterium]|jgi:hypothetical protein
MIMKTIFTTIFLALSGCIGLVAQEKVFFVTGEDAPPLETKAAEQLASQFKELFGVETAIVDFFPDGDGATVLIGSPKTNPFTKTGWPEGLSEQGHILKSMGASNLIVGGETPVATYWAACELGHQFGIRYSLHDDFMPIEKPKLTLADFDLVFEPVLRTRAWKTIGSGPFSQESWSLAEHQQLLGQLAKLKFNQVILALNPDQPFAEFDQKEEKGIVWGGEEFRVDGETAGRSVFGGAKVFENPDLAGKATYEKRIEAGMKIANGIISAAHDLGMKARIKIDKEHVEAARNSLPDADTTAFQLIPIHLGPKDGGVLPHFNSSLAMQLSNSRENAEGFVVDCSVPGDHTPDVFYLSRASFNSKISPEEALHNLFTPICGEGVSDRLVLGFNAIKKASAAIAAGGPELSASDPGMLMSNYRTDEAAPEWWAEAKGSYGEGVNEMYRANTRARGGARELTLYHAKRFTFALHYFTAIESTRAAGIAKAAGDIDAQIENLELAIEAIHNALAIYAEVVRDNSDRGVIALLNKYGYRPLLDELDKIPLP